MCGIGSLSLKSAFASPAASARRIPLSLINASSQRQIPLVGLSLWAAKKIVEHSKNDSDLAFPRYCSAVRCNSNSASGALNKWIKQTVGREYVVHSLRHSFRDRSVQRNVLAI